MKGSLPRSASALLRPTAIALVLFAGGAAVAQSTITELPPAPGFASSYALDINDSGVVVGSCAAADGSGETPTRWLSLVPGVLGGGAGFGRATGVNNNGQISISLQISDPPFVATGYRWDNGSLVEMPRFAGAPAPNSTYAFGIGPDGRIVGSASSLSGRTVPTAWAAQTNAMTGFLGGFIDPHAYTEPLNYTGYLYAAASPNEYVGWLYFAGSHVGLANRDGVHIPLFVAAPNFDCELFDVNQNGVAVGDSYNAGQPQLPGKFVYNASVETYYNSHLPRLPGAATGVALGVNDAGDIVGSCSVNGQARATYWPGGGPAIDLNASLPANSGWVLLQAQKINSLGVVCGFGEHNGQIRGFILNPDSDGDGLPDSWETATGGVDGDNDGVIDLRLYDPPFNARPDHKDIFVEVDSGPAFTLSAASAAMVIAAFANAPVHNPDTHDGITVHINRAEQSLPIASFTLTGPDNFPVDMDALRDAHMGDPGDSPALIAAKKKVYRYCLIYDDLAGHYAGRGELPGDQFVLAFGKPYLRDGVRDTADRAGVFMHELGHTLGLYHSGAPDGFNDDAIVHNGKPNYPSVMNYALTSPYEFCKNFWRLDYSREALATLSENDLDEQTGVAAASPLLRATRMPFGVDAPGAPGGRGAKTVKLDGSLTNWDNDSTTGETSVHQDLNWFGPQIPQTSLQSPTLNDVMLGHNDWASLEYAIGTTGSFAAGVHEAPAPAEEPSDDISEYMLANLPTPCDPFFTLHPEPVATNAGLFPTITVAAENGAPGGGAIAYRWRHAGQPVQNGPRIAGADSPTLRFNPVELIDAGVYDCVVTNGCASNESIPTTMVVANVCFGDADHNGVVNFLDLNYVLSDYGRPVDGPAAAAPGRERAPSGHAPLDAADEEIAALIRRWVVPPDAVLFPAMPPADPQRGFIPPNGDLNHDGIVDFLDLNIVLSFYGRNCNAP